MLTQLSIYKEYLDFMDTEALDFMDTEAWK